MPNPYGTWTKGVRPSASEPWKQDAHAREVFRGIDFAVAAIEALADPNSPGDGLRASIDDPLHFEVADGVVWSHGWWQSTDNRWWWLWKAADVASFSRQQADFYIPLGSLSDVPAS